MVVRFRRHGHTKSPLHRCKPSPSTSPWPDVHLTSFVTLRLRQSVNTSLYAHTHIYTHARSHKYICTQVETHSTSSQARTRNHTHTLSHTHNTSETLIHT